MAPRLRVRDQAALQAQFAGLSADEIADVLIDHAAHASAAGRRGAGMAAVLPVLPAFPAEVLAETLVVVGIEIKLVAELHEAYGIPAPGNLAERMSGYLAAWAHRRGRVHDRGRAGPRHRVAAGSATPPAAHRPGRPERGLTGAAAHRRRRGRRVQQPGDQEARP